MTPLDPAFHFRALDESHRPYGIVLDIGAGGACYQEQLGKAARHYATVDIVEGPSVDVVSDAHCIGIRSGCVDSVIITEVLEHLHSPWVAVQEIARVLRPGGLVLLSVPQYWHVHGWPSDYYRYTSYGLESLFSRAEFDVEAMVPMGGPFELTYAVLFLNMIPWIRKPVASIMFHSPALWLSWKLDETFFRDNLGRRNPDTRGWFMVARKRGEGSTRRRQEHVESMSR